VLPATAFKPLNGITEMVEEGYTRRDLVITLGFCFLPMIDRMRNIRGCEFEGSEIERGRKRSSRDPRL